MGTNRKVTKHLLLAKALVAFNSELLTGPLASAPHPGTASGKPTCPGLSLHHLSAGLLDAPGEGCQLVLGEVHLRSALQARDTGVP